MKVEKLEEIFRELEGSFDTEEPTDGHEVRFLEKLNRESKVVELKPKKRLWWRPLSIAASIAILLTVGIGFFQ